MRIRVLGNSDSAASVRGMLNQDYSVVVADAGYLYTVEIINTTSAIPTVDGVDSDWERRFIERISKAAGTDIMLLRAGGIQSDQYIRIGVPANSTQALVEKGIFQAILQMVNSPRVTTENKTWIERAKTWFV